MKARCWFHDILLLKSVPIQLNPPLYMFKVNFNIILSVSRYSNWFFSSRFFVCSSHLSMHTTCCAHFILLNLIVLFNVWSECKLRSSSLCIFSVLLLCPPPPYDQISYAPCCQRTRIHILLSEREAETEIHTKQRVKLLSCDTFNLQFFIGDGKTNGFEPDLFSPSATGRCIHKLPPYKCQMSNCSVSSVPCHIKVFADDHRLILLQKYFNKMYILPIPVWTWAY